MSGKYRKYQVDMCDFRDEYRLWKVGFDSIICQLESYKEKRSVYIGVKNLYPSKDLYAEKRQLYKTVLLGECNGEIIHQEFEGPYVDKRGEGTLYKKFTGDDIDKYQWCLLMAVGESEVESVEISKGSTPYFEGNRKNQQQEGEKCSPFSEGRDETHACWYKITDCECRQGYLADCQYNLKKYGHYLKGKGEGKTFVGIPGRFLLKEKPGGEKGPQSVKESFLLWQPIKGGEEFFDSPENMNAVMQERIFGYWIAELDEKNGAVYPF